MDVWNAVDGLRVVREYADRPIPEEDLRRILNAGRRAGSSRNKQRWDFVVVRERQRLKALTSTAPYGAHMAQAAAVVAIVTPDPRQPDASLAITWDSGRVAQNMFLVAWELGIGSCPITVYEPDRLREILGYPEEFHAPFLVALGYPADPGALTRANKPGGRRRLDEVVRWETW
jgi:nitroreductase